MFGNCHRRRLGDEVRREDKAKGAAAPKRPRPPDWLTPTEAGQPMETRNTTGNTAAKVTKNPQTPKRPPGMMGETSTPHRSPGLLSGEPRTLGRSWRAATADRRQTSTPKNAPIFAKFAQFRKPQEQPATENNLRTRRNATIFDDNPKNDKEYHPTQQTPPNRFKMRFVFLR